VLTLDLARLHYPSSQLGLLLMTRRGVDAADRGNPVAALVEARLKSGAFAFGPEAFKVP